VAEVRVVEVAEVAEVVVVGAVVGGAVDDDSVVDDAVVVDVAVVVVADAAVSSDVGAADGVWFAAHAATSARTRKRPGRVRRIEHHDSTLNRMDAVVPGGETDWTDGYRQRHRAVALGTDPSR
jgi:hypothetical protein